MEFIIEEKLLKQDDVEPFKKEAYELASIFIFSRKTAQGGKN
jgi:hypothetical protein